MGFRFSRRIRILPGVSVNLSKSGPSVSVGPRGAKHTIGSKGSRTTVGIPGTGISHTTTSSNNLSGAPPSGKSFWQLVKIAFLIVMVGIVILSIIDK